MNNSLWQSPLRSSYWAYFCYYLSKQISTKQALALRPIPIQPFRFLGTTSSLVVTRSMSSSTSQQQDFTATGLADFSSKSNNDVHLPRDISWRELLQESSEASRPIKGSNFVQLATVNPADSTPRVRTVVFRGFQDVPAGHDLHRPEESLSNLLSFSTDRRSEKVQQSSGASQPKQSAEVVWWFPHSNEQYRMRGELLFVGSPDDESICSHPFYNKDEVLQKSRVQMWEKHSDGSRESFFRSQAPGVSTASTDSNVSIPPGGRDANGTILPPPDTFLLMLLQPYHVDYLRLTDLYRQQDKYDMGKQTWSRVEVNY